MNWLKAARLTSVGTDSTWPIADGNVYITTAFSVQVVDLPRAMIVTVLYTQHSLRHMKFIEKLLEYRRPTLIAGGDYARDRETSSSSPMFIDQSGCVEAARLARLQLTAFLLQTTQTTCIFLHHKFVSVCEHTKTSDRIHSCTYSSIHLVTHSFIHSFLHPNVRLGRVRIPEQTAQ